MSYTYLGFAIYHGKKLMMAGLNTYEDALKAAYRIAKTDGYTYEFKDLLAQKWHRHRLPKNWRFLTIKEEHDFGGGATCRKAAKVSRKRAEEANAEPYESKSNVKRLKLPKGARRSFQDKEGSTYEFMEAYIERGYGLEIVYEETRPAERINAWIKESGLEDTLGLATEPSKTLHHITKENADKWAKAGLSAAMFERIEKEAGE